MDNQSDSPEPDFERWLKALQGESETDHPEGEALRAALLQEQVQRAQVGPGESEAAYELLRARMIKEGLLESTVDEPTAEDNVKPFPMSQTRKPSPWRMPVGWRPLAAIAAAVMLAMPLLLKYSGFGSDPYGPDTKMRGSVGTIIITASNTSDRAEKVMGELVALELEPTLEDTDDRIAIRVEVDRQSLEAFFQWANGYGGRALAPGTYRILIQSEDK